MTESGSTTQMYFSFDFGNVHFISISTETDFPGSYVSLCLLSPLPPLPSSLYLLFCLLSRSSLFSFLSTLFPSPYGENYGLQLKWLEADLQKANLPENRFIMLKIIIFVLLQ